MQHFIWEPTDFQLPYRTGPHGTQARLSIDQTMTCLIQISRYRFSLVISGLTKMLQRVNEIVSPGATDRTSFSLTFDSSLLFCSFSRRPAGDTNRSGAATIRWSSFWKRWSDVYRVSRRTRPDLRKRWMWNCCWEKFASLLVSNAVVWSMAIRIILNCFHF